MRLTALPYCHEDTGSNAQEVQKIVCRACTCVITHLAITVRPLLWEAREDKRKPVPKRILQPSFIVMTTCGGHDETVSTPRQTLHLFVEIHTTKKEIR